MLEKKHIFVFVLYWKKKNRRKSAACAESIPDC